MARPERQVIPTSAGIFDSATLLFLLATLIFLYAFLFVLPFIPIDIHGDGVVWISDAKRMYEAEVMYRDFFEFLAPGTPLVFFCLFKSFGPRLWIPDVALLALGLALAWLGVVTAKKLMRPGTALLSSAIFLVGVYKNQLDPTHHWFSLLCTTAALALLLERRTLARIAGAGFFCGLTACFTQTRGLAVVVGFGVFLWWESRRRGETVRELLKKQAWLVAGFLATIIAVDAYFIWEAGLVRFLWNTIIFPVKYGPKMADVDSLLVFRRDLPEFTSLSNFLLRSMGWLFLYSVIPFIYILFFARYRRESGKQPSEFWERPMLLAIVGSFMLLSVAPAPSYLRVSASALLGVILLGWFIDSARKLRPILLGALTLGILVVIPHAVTRSPCFKASIIATPQGELAERDVDRQAYTEYIWVQQHTRPSEYFYKPADADMYFSLNLRNPTPMPFVVNNAFTTRDQVAEVIRGLKQHPVRYILWSHNKDDDLDTIPYWENPSDDHLGPLRDYIHSHYRPVEVFANSDEIWGRKD
jgi:hypothetical protein